MSTHRLDEPVLEPGVRFPHFFNGRMLSGEDLTHERAANFTRQRHLAGALGSGIAHGFEISWDTALHPDRAAPVLTIAPGLALSASGHTLRMEHPIDLAVVEPPSTAPASTGNLDFTDCETLPASVYLTGAGVYLLTVGPADRKEGSAPVSGLGNGLAPCNAKYIAEGVRFSLLPLDVTAGSTPDRARNEIAYQCFGVTAAGLVSDLANPRGPGYAPANPLAALVPRDLLTGCEVPLAVVQWTSSGLGFVDMWAARRRLTQPYAGGHWGGLLADRDAARNEAMFFQFQDHLASIQAEESDLPSVEARRFFQYLPSLGFLPLAPSGRTDGFDRNRFFQGNTVRDPLHVEGAKLRHFLQLGRDFPPIDLSSPQMIWRYLVRENVQATATPPLLLFGSGQLPYLAVPQFDVSAWNYSNYVVS
ncbi:MAG TPA: hypothetical protein VG734_12570 [Lacunisphaera sp.]|nr:hypothetical protein [Lacunisphaera sp.]